MNSNYNKILYFLDFPHCVGGSNRTLLTQAYIMQQRGYDVVVVMPNDNKGKHDQEYDSICRKFDLQKTESKFDFSVCMENIDVLSLVEHYSEVLDIVKKENPDIIHSVQINATVEMVARQLHIPHLMNIYQTDLEAFSIKWLDIYPHYHSSDSELFSSRWGEGLQIASRCIRTAYKTRNYKSHFSNNNPIRLITIGVLCERKKQFEILKFVLRCKENGMQIVHTFLGYNDNSYGEKCKEFVRTHNLQNEVIFEGFISDVDAYLKQSDLMVIASDVESFPVVAVEAMATNVPILTTPVAGLPELLKDGHNCFMTSGYTGDDIYEAFNRFRQFRDTDLEGIIKSAYETYLHNHTYEVVGNNLEQYYSWICEDYIEKDTDYIDIESLKALFSDFISESELNNADPYTKTHLWFLFHLNKKIYECNFQKIIIWGAGNFGRIAIEWLDILHYTDRLVGFVDSEKKGEYLNHPILADKEQAVKEADMVLIAVADLNSCLEIMSYIEQSGKKRNENYFLMVNDSMRL